MKAILAGLALFLAGVSLAVAAVNINTATVEQLDAVKGIGPGKAQAIVDYREKHGAFKTLDDLKHVKGFGQKSVNKLRGELSVDGANQPPAAKGEAHEKKSHGKQAAAAKE